MFSFLKKDPLKALEKEYAELYEKAMHFQRNGDLKTYADLISKADEVGKKIEALKAAKS